MRRVSWVLTMKREPGEEPPTRGLPARLLPERVLRSVTYPWATCDQGRRIRDCDSCSSSPLEACPACSTWPRRIGSVYGC